MAWLAHYFVDPGTLTHMPRWSIENITAVVYAALN